MHKIFPIILFLIISCSNQNSIAIDSLASPRGLFSLNNGNILVAEVAAGRILEWDPNSGSLEVLLDDLPYTEKGPESVPAGVSAALFLDGWIYFVVGEHRAKGFREIYKAEKNSQPLPMTGQDIQALEPPNRITNPYDIAAAPQGGFFVSDSGRDAVWHISEEGIIKDYKLFTSYSYTLDDASVIQLDVVPTGIEVGTDNALYVASLTGYPFPRGGSHIYRLQDLNGDGDALDLGESSIFATGFSAATDLAFDNEGSLFVTEFSSNMKILSESEYDRTSEFRGQLVKWQNGLIEVQMADLISPTAVIVTESGKIYVSEEFAGKVTEVKR